MAKEEVFEFEMGSLDDLPDLPGFATFPTGAFHIQLAKGMIQKKIGTRPGIECELTLKNVLELDPKDLDKGEQPPKEGDTCNIIFLMDNDTGKGMFKSFAAVLAEILGTRDIKTILKDSKDVELIVTGVRTVDEVKKRSYFNVKLVAAV